MSGARPGPSLHGLGCLLLLVILACVLVPGSNGQDRAPSQLTCRNVIIYCNHLENTIHNYREKMARQRLQISSWSEAERQYSRMRWYYSEFNYLKRVPSSFSAAKPYIDHLRYSDELLRSYQFALDQVQLDLALHPERDNIHIKKNTKIAKQLEDLHNEIRRETLQTIPPLVTDLTDLNHMLEESYIPFRQNDDRKARHFLTLFEILRGMTYIKQVFGNC